MFSALAHISSYPFISGLNSGHHYSFSLRITGAFIYINSILHILTIVYSDTLDVKYLPTLHGSYSTV